MNVVILCGGRGSRLAGLWDHAKCLVPLGDGHPIITHLIRRAHALHPQHIILVTGHRGDEVASELRRLRLLHPRLVVFREAHPAGTAVAVRVVNGWLDTDTLILNGDTLPRYELSAMLQPTPINGYWQLTRAMCGGRPAGAVRLSAMALQRLVRETQHSDLDAWIDASPPELSESGIYHLFVRGFLDVGAPEGFALAQTWMENLK